MWNKLFYFHDFLTVIKKKISDGIIMITAAMYAICIIQPSPEQG
jgi:hypothetical protein